MKRDDLLSTKLDQDHVEKKIMSLLAGGAKLIDPSKKPELDMIEGTFSNSWSGTYPEIPVSKSIGWSMYEDIGTAVFNPKGVSKMGIFSTPFQILLERPLPGRSRCSLMARYNPDKQVVQITVKYFLINNNNDEFEAFKDLGVMGSQGFELGTYLEPPGDLFSLSQEDILSAVVMNVEAVRRIEGPTWEQVRSDSFWATFERDAFNIAQVAIVHNL